MGKSNDIAFQKCKSTIYYLQGLEKPSVSLNLDRIALCRTVNLAEFKLLAQALLDFCPGLANSHQVRMHCNELH